MILRPSYNDHRACLVIGVRGQKLYITEVGGGRSWLTSSTQSSRSCLALCSTIRNASTSSSHTSSTACSDHVSQHPHLDILSPLPSPADKASTVLRTIYPPWHRQRSHVSPPLPLLSAPLLSLSPSRLAPLTGEPIRRTGGYPLLLTTAAGPGPITSRLRT